MWQSIPELGAGLVLAILVIASYTFAVSIAAAAGRPRLLSAARTGAYGTVAIIATAVLVLAYAFSVTTSASATWPATATDPCRTGIWSPRCGGDRTARSCGGVSLSVYIAAGRAMDEGPLSRAAAVRDRHVDGRRRRSSPCSCSSRPTRSRPSRGRAAGRRGAQPAAPELLDDDPPAERCTWGSSVLVPFAFAWPRWSRDGSKTSGSWRCASGCCSRLDVPDHRQPARHVCGRTRSSAGAATGRGIRSRTPRSCRWLERHRLPALGDDPRAPRHAEGVERLPALPDLHHDHLRHVPHPLGAHRAACTRSPAVRHRHLLRVVSSASSWWSAWGSSSGACRCCAPRSTRSSRCCRAKFAFLLNNWVLLGRSCSC